MLFLRRCCSLQLVLKWPITLNLTSRGRLPNYSPLLSLIRPLPLVPLLILPPLQTWFGKQPWKSYGIQMVPLTPASELRDDPAWIEEMLPLFAESCLNDTGKIIAQSLLPIIVLISFIAVMSHVCCISVDDKLRRHPWTNETLPPVFTHHEAVHRRFICLYLSVAIQISTSYFSFVAVVSKATSYPFLVKSSTSNSQLY